MRVIKCLIAAIGLLALDTSRAAAQDVWITEEMPFATFEFLGQNYTFERNQDPDARLEDSFAKTSRPCPPFCVHAMKAAEGVETIGELELIEFAETHVQDGTGLIIDSRLDDWYRAGTIPGAINLPFTLFETFDNPFITPVLQQLGARGQGRNWDFSEAKHLALFCNGPWCDQSPRAIRNLISLGYPPEKLLYYRGGMQAWLIMGFTTVQPEAS